MKFELLYSGFFNPDVDLYDYTLRDIAFCDRIDEVHENNVKQFFENSMIIDKNASSLFIRKAEYENGEWHLRG